MKHKFYEETWFCIIIYIIFFPIGLILTLRSKSISKDIKNLLKLCSVIIAIFYAYLVSRFVINTDTNLDTNTSSIQSINNQSVVNRDEFSKQGDVTIKNIESVLGNYESSKIKENYQNISENSKEIDSEEDIENENGIASANNSYKFKGDPYEYKIDYATSIDDDNGFVNLVIQVKYPAEYVLDFSNSEIIKELLGVMEGDNYNFNEFNSWVKKSEENYSNKNVISSSIYNRNVLNLEETLNFGTGEEGLMQLCFVKKVKVE